MRVRFWGTRGSIATPGPATVRYGGNTACVEVRTDDGTLIILDSGTGIRPLGQALMASGEKPLRGHLLITHTHWDHIQGFPFFVPLFIPGNEWDIYAPGITGRRLEDTLSGQMEYTYFPVRLDQLGATIRYHDVAEGTFQIGDARITSRYLNHPSLTLGYRIECGGASLVYATDHEPHSHHRLELPGGSGKVFLNQPLHLEDRRHVKFLTGADLVIHDAQFTAAQDASRVGWGHTAAEQVVDFALAAGIERLVLFHHDPTHDDESVDKIVEICQERVARQWTGDDLPLEVTAAAEGQSITLSENVRYKLHRQMAQWKSQPAEPLATPATPPGIKIVAGVPQPVAFNGNGNAPSSGHSTGAGSTTAVAKAGVETANQVDRAVPVETVLLVDGEDSITRLTRALEPEGVLLITATSTADALSSAANAHPDVILIGAGLAEVDPLQISRQIRAAGNDVPLVLLSSDTEASYAAQSFDAGVTDHLMLPVTPAQVRARVRRWLQRHRLGTL